MQANVGPWSWQYRLSATKMTKGQYTTVRLEQATCRLVSSLLHGTKQKNTQLMIISMTISIRPNPDQERTTQNAQIYHKTTMPYNNTKSSLSYDLFWNQGLILKKRCTVAHVQCFFFVVVKILKCLQDGKRGWEEFCCACHNSKNSLQVLWM